MQAEDRGEYNPYDSEPAIREREGHMRVRASRGEMKMRGGRGAHADQHQPPTYSPSEYTPQHQHHQHQPRKQYNDMSDDKDIESHDRE